MQSYAIVGGGVVPMEVDAIQQKGKGKFWKRKRWWSKQQCRKFQADKASGHVRQVNDDGTGSVAAESSITMTSTSVPASAGVSTVPQGSSSSGASNIRVISSVNPYVHDLTALKTQMGAADDEFLNISVVKSCCDSFDMSCADDDGIWTVPPDFHFEQDCHHECENSVIWSWTRCCGGCILMNVFSLLHLMDLSWLRV